MKWKVLGTARGIRDVGEPVKKILKEIDTKDIKYDMQLAPVWISEIIESIIEK